MAKSTMVKDPVDQQLQELQENWETFSQAIAILVAARAELCRSIDFLEGIVRFREWQDEHKETVRDAESTR